MCGRYYMDGQMVEDIMKIIRRVDARLKRERQGDIHPTDVAPIITKEQNELYLKDMKWGLQPFQGNQLLINARAETVMDKRSFADSVRHRRCVIPAKKFYEWDNNKSKVTFSEPENSVMYMAGFSQMYEDGEHFIIITTKANESMKPVHDRMPLILEQSEIETWINDDGKLQEMLTKKGPMLDKKRDYEQLSFL